MNENEKIQIERVIRALKWLVDRESGEMIECYRDYYYRDFLGFPETSKNDLELICVAVNSVSLLAGYGVCVGISPLMVGYGVCVDNCNGLKVV